LAGRDRAWRHVALLGALLVVLGVAGAGSAEALVIKLPNGRTVSIAPLRGALRSAAVAGTGKLEYHGGPVMSSNTNYTLYWDPAGAPEYPPGYQEGVNRYLEDLAHDSGGEQNVDSIATQYGDSAGEFANYDSHFAGALIDTDPYPKNGCAAAAICFTEAQIQTELKNYIKAKGLPHDLNHEYFLLTPPGVEDCFEAAGLECSAGTTSPSYCAYHNVISLTGGPLIFANDPYVAGVSGCDDGEHPNNSPSDATLQGGLSHEHNESITDPELNAWYDAKGNENGDKCRTFNESTEYGTPLGTAPDGSRYNQVVDGDLYWYQQEWSNAGLVCEQRLASVSAAPSVTKISPKTGPASGGTSVKITGTNFTSVTAVRFGAANATGFTVESATSITAVAPAGSVGVVDVTVTTNGGTSALSSADHFKYKPAITGLSPNAGPASGGTLVTISGSGFATGAGETGFKFGTTAATGVSCSSSTSCTALSPKHATGTVHVVAKVNGIASAKTSADEFTYQ
jgi:hypothetical protein